MSGAIGSTVTITGSDFVGANLVSFYDYPTTYTVVSPTQITATVPAGTPSPGRWRVRTSAGLAVYDPLFTVGASLPTISSVSPMSGPVGSTVTITGSNFTGVNLVSFYDYPTTYTVVSPTQITATVPAGTPSPGRWRVRTSAGLAVHDPLFSVGPDVTAPTNPGSLVASGQTQTSITLSWSSSSDNVAVSGYGRYRNGTLVSSGTGTSYTFAGLTCGTAYTLGVDAYDAAGNRSSRSTLGASTAACVTDTTPPSVPQGQTISATTQTTITMTWEASTDNVAVAGYRAFLDGAVSGTTTQLTYTYTGLTCGTTYTVALEAYDAAGNASNRAFAQGPASTTACSGDTQAPSTPGGLAATGSTETSISLTWTASVDNVGVAGYSVYNGATNVASTALPSFDVTGLACGTSYTLGVDAYDAAGNRSARAQVNTSTAACSGPPPPPAAGSANLWVDPSGGTCTRQATAGSYVDAQACASLPAAYNAAQSGDVVNIVDGTYGSQGLNAGSKTLTFRAAGPGRPSFGHFVSAASGITVRGILIEDRNDINGPCPDPDNGVLHPCGANQTFDNVIIDGRNAGGKHGIAAPGRGFTLKNSEVRNIVDMKGFEGGADDMLIENNYWHDIRVTNSSVHNECMFVNNGNRSIYRGNLFIKCPTMALFFTNWNGGPAYRDVLVENNVFGHTIDDNGSWHPSCPLKVGWGYNNQNTVIGWVIRYNTMEVGPCLDGTPAGGDTGAAQYYGNLGGIQCAAEFVYRYNVGETCGGVGDFFVPNAANNAGAPNQAPFYVNAPAGDFHLRAGAAAIDRGDPNLFPNVDRDQNPRPVGTAPDAGAYEWR